MAPDWTDPGFTDALVILGAAGIVIPAFARLRISPVIGFILVGVLVGPAGLGRLSSEQPWLQFLTISDPEGVASFAELGVVMLLFSIGLELSFRRLWAMRAQVFGVGAVELFGSGLAIALALFALGQAPLAALGLGLALALSSTALVITMVGAESPVGRSAFAMLLFEDLALVPIILALAAIGPMAGGGAAIAWVLLKALIAVGALLLSGRMLLPRLFSQAARTKSPELFLAASLLVAIIASAATAAVGLSPIVGALIAGLLIAETDYHGEVEAITKPFTGLALGVFLITVGMRLDLAQVVAHWPALLAGVCGVITIKALVTFACLQLTGVNRPIAAEIALLLASPSETTLIVLGVAVQAQLILPGTAAYWQIITAIGLTLTPLLGLLGRLTGRQIARRAGGDSPDAVIPPEGAGTVIVGFGRVGRMIAELLRHHGKTFVAVEADIDAVLAARRDGYPVLFGDVARAELVDRLNLGRAQALVITMDDPVLSVRLTRRVRGWVPELPIIARARDADHAAELYRAGATEAVPETLESSLQLAETVLTDLGVAAGPVIVSVHEQRDALRRAIRDQAGLARDPRLRRVRAETEAAGPDASEGAAP